MRKAYLDLMTESDYRRMLAEHEEYQASLGEAATFIVDSAYAHGVPGRACLSCNSAWPATEADDESWHHANGCPAAVTAFGAGIVAATDDEIDDACTSEVRRGR